MEELAIMVNIQCRFVGFELFAMLVEDGAAFGDWLIVCALLLAWCLPHFRQNFAVFKTRHFVVSNYVGCFVVQCVCVRQLSCAIIWSRIV